MGKNISIFVIDASDTRNPSKRYGKLPTKTPVPQPFYQVHVDLIGPYFQEGKTNVKHWALSIIEPVTRMLELHPVKPKTSARVAKIFRDQYL